MLKQHRQETDAEIDFSFREHKWSSAKHISAFGAGKETANNASRKSSASQRSPHRQSRSPSRKASRAVSIAGGPSSAQSASEGPETRIVPIHHDVDAVAPHLKSILEMMRSNVAQLSKFVTNLPRLTSSEMHAARTKLKALLASQAAALDDLCLFSNEEAVHYKQQVSDLQRELHGSADSSAAGGQLLSMQVLYSMMNSVTNTCNSHQGILLLYPSAGSSADLEFGASRSRRATSPGRRRTGFGDSPSRGGAITTTLETPEPHSGRASPSLDGATGGAVPSPRPVTATDALNMLQVVSHVSTAPFTSESDGSIHADIFDVCAAVGRSRCAANFTATNNGVPMNFVDLLAVPVLHPTRSQTALGVLCLVDKVTRYGTAKFGPEDEIRATCAAEQVAEHLISMPLKVSAKVPLQLSPPTWQATLQRNGGLSEAATGVSDNVRESIRTRFVFRSEYSGSSLTNMKFRSRTAIEPGEVLMDVLDRCHTLEKQLELSTRRAADALARVDDAERMTLYAKAETRKAVKDSHDMRTANERLLRSAVFRNVAQGNESVSSRVSPPSMAQPISSAMDNSGVSPAASVAEFSPSSHREFDMQSSSSRVASARSQRDPPQQRRTSVGIMRSSLSSAGGRSAREKAAVVASQPASARPGTAGSTHSVSGSGDQEVDDITGGPVIPKQFVSAANQLRHRSFFPTPPSPWNKKSKPAVASKPLIH